MRKERLLVLSASSRQLKLQLRRTRRRRLQINLKPYLTRTGRLHALALRARGFLAGGLLHLLLDQRTNRLLANGICRWQTTTTPKRSRMIHRLHLLPSHSNLHPISLWYVKVYIWQVMSTHIVYRSLTRPCPRSRVVLAQRNLCRHDPSPLSPTRQVRHGIAVA